jgi:hypothetical protein
VCAARPHQEHKRDLGCLRWFCTWALRLAPKCGRATLLMEGSLVTDGYPNPERSWRECPPKIVGRCHGARFRPLRTCHKAQSCSGYEAILMINKRGSDLVGFSLALREAIGFQPRSPTTRLDGVRAALALLGAARRGLPRPLPPTSRPSTSKRQPMWREEASQWEDFRPAVFACSHVRRVPSLGAAWVHAPPPSSEGKASSLVWLSASEPCGFG